MLKKLLILLCVLALAISCTGCFLEARLEKSKAPDRAEVGKSSFGAAQEFSKALLKGDGESVASYVPEFEYDALIRLFGGEVKEGEDEAKALADIITQRFKRDDVRIVGIGATDGFGDPEMLDNIKAYHRENNTADEATVETLLDARCVTVTPDIQYDGQDEVVSEPGDIPCVRIGDMWYVDYLYLLSNT